MSHWENTGKSNEWYTPKYVFDALGVYFDLDAAHPKRTVFCSVPCKDIITENSLTEQWIGFVWLNPPFGGRNGIDPWLDKMATHNNGIALTPDRTSTEWWQKAANNSGAHLQVFGKIQFINEDGEKGKSPSTGTTLFAYGDKAIRAILNAQKNGLGTVFRKLI